MPTLKDIDFLNKNQKVYIGEEEKKVFLEKLKRDVEVIIGVLGNAFVFVFVFSFSCFFHLQYERAPPFSLLFGFSACSWVGYQTST